MNTFRRRPLFYLFVLLAVFLFFFADKLGPDLSRFEGLESEKLYLGGIIVSDVQKSETVYGQEQLSFILKTQRIWSNEKGWQEAPFLKTKVILKEPPQSFEYGDEVVIQGRLSLPDKARNPGGFNYRQYLKNQGVYYIFYADKNFRHKVLRRDRGFFPKKAAIQIRHYFSGNLEASFDAKTAPFLQAMFLGERHDIDDALNALFMNTGTMHILSVSGFHVGFLLVIIYFGLGLFKVHRNIRLYTGIFFIWFYCFIVGWQAPMVRASVMATLLIFGRLLGRKADTLNILGAAGLLILLVRPVSAQDIGFQLSFLTVMGLILFMPVFDAPLRLLPNEKWTWNEHVNIYLKSIFWASFVCMVISLPVTIQNFYMVTPSSLLANLVVVPLSFGIFVLGFSYFMTFWWLPKVLSFIPTVMQFGMKFFIRTLEGIESIPGSYWITGKLDLFLWLILVIGIVYLLWDKRILSPMIRAVAIILFITNILIFQSLWRLTDRRFIATFLDVGQGDAAFFRFPDDSNMLIDTGKENSHLNSFLRSEGVRRIDLLVLTHPQEDHIGGSLAVFKDFEIKNLLWADSAYPTLLYKKVRKAAEKERVNYLIGRAGYDVEGFKGVEIKILNPSHAAPSKEINNESIVLKITYGSTHFLMTGDIQAPAIEDILSSGANLQSDVLKVPHHGGKIPNEIDFLKAVQPKYSVISAGRRNIYHHPSAITLQTLEAIPNNRILRTDQSGAVQIQSNGDKASLL